MFDTSRKSHDKSHIFDAFNNVNLCNTVINMFKKAKGIIIYKTFINNVENNAFPILFIMY